MYLKDKTVLLTGAGGGIGSAIAEKLTLAGAKIILFGGNNLSKLELTAQKIKDVGGECVIKAGNLTSDTFIEKAVDEVAKETGGIDVLINNAGMALNSTFEQTNAQIFDKIMNINVRAPYLLTQKVLPYLLKSDRASIINIASVVSHAGYANQSAYVASKHALLGFTKSLAAEVYEKGVRVHAISPGGVYTDMVKISRPDLTPDGMIMPNEIAEIVDFLLKNRGNAVIDEIIVHRLNKTPFLV